MTNPTTKPTVKEAKLHTNTGKGKIDKREEAREAHTPHFSSRADNRSKTQTVE